MPDKETFGSRLKHAWNAFFNRDPPYGDYAYTDIGPSYAIRPDRPVPRMSTERTILTAIINRIAIDVSQVNIQHVRLDANGRYQETMDSGLNNCLTLEANIDQNALQFKHNLVFSLLDEGFVALVPVDTTMNPNVTDSYDIKTMRIGRIQEWYPQFVKVELYNERTGLKELLTLPKRNTAIIENPLYAVMNDPNGTLKRLVHKMALLDRVDEQTGSGKLNILMQLPYALKGEARINQAEDRRKTLESQLNENKLGVGYIDSTERVIQLNRPLENGLQQEIEYLSGQLYNEIGFSQAVFNGTASDTEQTNYQNKLIEPIVAAIALEMKRKFLTKTARTQGQSIYYFKEPFKFIPISALADIADVMTRNAIMSSNEFRQILGMKVVDTQDADALRNKNMPMDTEPYMDYGSTVVPPMDGYDANQNEEPLREVGNYAPEV